MERHIGDTRTVRWEIYYVHPQSGHRLFYISMPVGCRFIQSDLHRRKSTAARQQNITVKR